MKNIVHHMKTSDEVTVTVMCPPGRKNPEMWEFNYQGKVILVGSEKFEPKRAIFYSNNNPIKSEAKVSVDVGDHILVMTRNDKQGSKIAIFRVLYIEKNDTDTATVFTISIKRVFYHNRSVIDNTVDPAIAAFVGRAIRISVDSQFETYWSMPWGTFKQPSRTEFFKLLTETYASQSFAYDGTEKSLNNLYKELRESKQGSETSKTPVLIRYMVWTTEEGNEELLIDFIPLNSSVSDVVAAMESNDLRKLVFENKCITVNSDDASLYQMDKITTFGQNSKEDLIKYINKSTNLVVGEDGSKTRIVIRIFKK